MAAILNHGSRLEYELPVPVDEPPVFLMGCGQPASTGGAHSQRSAAMGSTREARCAGR